jgi:threonylcarbamoyladenosine tRNA methylthiotransferase MtaB
VKLYLRTFGCRANQYDSETVRAMVAGAGGVLVESPADADVAVFNSCAVTADAVADLRQQVRRAARANPALRSIVMGCAPGLGGATAREVAALPTVDAVITGADARAVGDALGVSSPSPVTRQQSGARALLRIQVGCAEHCTFCATTLARGAHRSRAAAELVREARALAARHEEIVLTGVHVGGWGRETGSSLGALLEQLVHEVPRVRFRLTSVEATEVDERLADLLVGAPRRVAPHLHAPLQSGSDRLLRRMGRHWYTAVRYAAAVERLAARAPVFALGADVITGFPGEREEDHAATLSLVRALPFTSLHVFPYSPRPGTAAERLPDHVPPRLARERAAELRDVAAERVAAHRRARAGAVADLVALNPGVRRFGLTEDYLEVAIPADAPPRFDARLELAGESLAAAAVASRAG